MAGCDLPGCGQTRIERVADLLGGAEALLVSVGDPTPRAPWIKASYLVDGEPVRVRLSAAAVDDDAPHWWIATSRTGWLRLCAGTSRDGYGGPRLTP